MPRSRRRSSSRRRSCPRGMIRRVSYTTKRGSRVRSSCIKDRGAPGKGPKILPKPKKGGLPGFHLDEPQSERHRILKRLAERKGCVKILREVNLIRNYNTKGTTNHKKLSKDVKFMEKLCRQMKRGRSRSRSRSRR